ncbi:MAG: hypothetical protein LBI72_08205 [Flavobacteriaceae bacterium]|nr:hypothetical protein [Flavobacteriaceae bacterium]
MKLQVLFSCILFTTISFAQEYNPRLIIQKSNLVIETKDYEKKQELINDYTTKHTIKVSTINQVFKNKIDKAPQSLSAKIATFNMDYFGDSCNDFRLGPPIYDGPTYSLLFLYKDKSGFHLIKEYDSIDEELLLMHKKMIDEYAFIEKLTNPKERFSKTLDWFISNKLEPDTVFLEYYTHQGYIIDGHIPYTDAQYKKGLSLFDCTQEAYEEPLSFLKKKYYNELRASHLTQMQLIIDKKERTFTDRYNFKKMVAYLTNNFEGSATDEDYDRASKLFEDENTDEKNLEIMKYLFKVASDWKPTTDE